MIIEQDIHAIDVATWFAGADPIKAVGTGSKWTRKYGDIWAISPLFTPSRTTSR